MLHVEYQMLLIDSACLPSKFFLLHLLDFFHLPEVPDETEIFERTLDDGYRGESETEPPSSEHSPKNSEQMEEVEVERLRYIRGTHQEYAQSRGQRGGSEGT